MSGFKIRGIFSPEEDDYLTYVGIDDFDNSLFGENEDYYFAASVLEEDGSIRPRNRQHSGFAKDNESIGICYDDEYSLPTPNMYLALGQILKERGMVFNKKKSRFQVIKKGETT